MDGKRAQRLKDLPPAEHAVGIYIGLLVGGLVLGIGTVLLFRDLFFIFTEEGIKLNEVILFRILLFFATSFASLACFFAFFKMVFLQRSQVRKVNREFRDFTVYARPLVEEILRQRIISENLSEKLDRFGRRAGFADESIYDTGPPELREFARRGEFLVSVAVLSSVSIGLFIYLERHPWELVPYSLIILSVVWWYVVARYFDLVYDIRSYYVPAMFVMLVPSLSIILRAFIRPYQAVYLVFVLLFIYVWAMYTYFDYITGGRAPEIFSVVSSKVMEFPPSRRLIRAVGNGDVSERINGLFPQRKNGGPGKKAKNGDKSDRINGFFPPRKNGGTSGKKAKNGNMPKRINGFFPERKDGGPHAKTKNGDMPDRINGLFPERKNGESSNNKVKNGDMSERINGFFPERKNGGPNKKAKNGDMSERINGLFPPRNQ